MAGPDKLAQRCAHGLHRGDTLFKRFEMHIRDAANLRAGSAPVPPLRQKFVDLFYRKAEQPCAADEAQFVQVTFRVLAVVIGRPRWRLQEPDGLIVADHLCANAGHSRSFADIHVDQPVDLTTVGRCRVGFEIKQGSGSCLIITVVTRIIPMGPIAPTVGAARSL